MPKAANRFSHALREKEGDTGTVINSTSKCWTLLRLLMNPLGSVRQHYSLIYFRFGSDSCDYHFGGSGARRCQRRTSARTSDFSRAGVLRCNRNTLNTGYSHHPGPDAGGRPSLLLRAAAPGKCIGPFAAARRLGSIQRTTTRTKSVILQYWYHLNVT